MKKTFWIIYRLLFVANLVLAVLLLLTCLLYLVSVPFLSVFLVSSLLVPALFFLNVFFLVFWIVKRNKRLLLSLIAISIAYFTFGTFYKLGNGSGTNDTFGIKVMTYNAWGFNKNEWIKEPNIGDRIVKFIGKEDPDILCLQEYDRKRRGQLTQFPYKAITPISQGKTTQAIFSKYPILSEGSLNFPGTINNVIYVDILINLDTIRVYNIHLQSFSIVPSSETFSEEQSQKNYKRLVRTFEKQLDQAKIVHEHKLSSPYPVVVCGDLNNTQFSSIYRILKGEMQDSFLEKGDGFGKTYSLFGFPLRIDYVLTDLEFEVLSHKNYNVKLSDHYPIMATLRLESD